MLITTAAIILGFGIVSVVVGQLFGHHELGVIGGVIILGVGVVVTGTGLEQPVGETIIEVNNSTTETITETEPVETPQNLSLGTMIMLIGGVVVLRSFESFSRQ